MIDTSFIHDIGFDVETDKMYRHAHGWECAVRCRAVQNGSYDIIALIQIPFEDSIHASP